MGNWRTHPRPANTPGRDGGIGRRPADTRPTGTRQPVVVALLLGESLYDTSKKMGLVSPRSHFRTSHCVRVWWQAGYKGAATRVGRAGRSDVDHRGALARRALLRRGQRDGENTAAGGTVAGACGAAVACDDGGGDSHTAQHYGARGGAAHPRQRKGRARGVAGGAARRRGQLLCHRTADQRRVPG
eukprot:gene2342-biopygen11026